MKSNTHSSLPRLKMAHLATLAAVADTGSVVAASEQLNVTASAVSHRLRQAENILGIQLVVKDVSGFRLNEEGQHIAAFAVAFLPQLNDLEAALAG